MKETTSDGRGQFRQTLTAEPQRTRITVRPPIIPGEFEPHPDTERLDYVLSHLDLTMFENNEKIGLLLERLF
jgi:hypothetical protein